MGTAPTTSRTSKCVRPSRSVGSIHYEAVNRFRVERSKEKAERSEALGNKKLALSVINPNWEKTASVRGLEVLADIRKVISPDVKVKCCGLVKKGERVAIQASKDGAVGVQGGHTCKSSMCPTCSPKKDAKRALSVELILNRWEREGYWVSFGTATLSHSIRQSIEEVGDDFKEAWRRARLNTKNAVKKQLGLDVLVEFSFDWTIGDNGFHPHGHFLTMVEKKITKAEANFIEATWKDKWKAAVVKLGRKVSKKAGMKFVEVDLSTGEFLASYLSKTSKVSYEVVGSSTKTGNDGNLSISGIWEGMRKGDKKCIAIFHQLSRWLKGKQVFNRCARLNKIMKEERGAVIEEEKAPKQDVFLLGSGAQRQVEKRKLYIPLMRLAHRLMTTGGQLVLNQSAEVVSLLTTWNKEEDGRNNDRYGELLERKLRGWRV